MLIWHDGLYKNVICDLLYKKTTSLILLYMKSSKTAMLKGCLRVLVENRMILACTNVEGSDHLRVKDIKCER